MTQRATGLTCASGVLMVGAVLLAWWNSFSGALIYDDVPAITANPSIHKLWSAWSSQRTDLTVSGRPLGNLSLAINYAFSGTAVGGYHVLNCLIHLFAGLALFGVVRRTLLRPALQSRFGHAAPWLALAVAAIWLVHPLQTESVTYIIQRVESLMGLFYLVTLYCFIRAAEALDPAKWTRWHTGAVFACLAGMASKEVMVSAPVLVLLYDRMFFAGSFREAFRRRAGFYVALAATWLPLVDWVYATGGRGGSAGFGGPVSSLEYSLLQCPAVVHYLQLTFWPRPLVFDYGILPATNLAHVAGPAVILLSLAGVTLIGLWRKAPASMLGAWFGMILAPSSSFVPVGTETMAEHRMYLPLAAVVGLIALSGFRLVGLRIMPALAAVALGLAWVTAQRNNDYHSEFTIWSDTVAKNPDNARAHNNLGSLWLARGNLSEAERSLTHALKLQPSYASAHYNLGIALLRNQQFEEAADHFLTAIRLEENFTDARVNAGNAFLKLGRGAAAVREFESALRLQPDSPDLHYDLGLAFALVARTADAIHQYERAIHLQPEFYPAQAALGSALLKSGQPGTAIPHLQTALRLDPQSLQVYLDLGDAEAAQGNPVAAERCFREAVRLHPDRAAAHFYLGNLLAQASRVPEAIGEYQAALQAEPGNLEVRNNLGNALLIAERVDEAIVQYEEILRLRPNDPGVVENLRQARTRLQSARRNP